MIYALGGLFITTAILLAVVFHTLRSRNSWRIQCEQLINSNALLHERNQFFQRIEAEFEQAKADNHRLSIENSELRQAIKYEREAYQEKLKTYQDLQQQIEQSLKNTTQQALLSNNDAFLNLAKNTFEQLMETTKQDLNHRQQHIGSLFDPVHKTLSQVDEKLQALEKDRITAYVDLRRQIQEMSSTQTQLKNETSNLVKALRTPVARGQWGEIQLKRVVEISGMLSHCDFIEQKSSEDGKLRPDLIINLPGGKNIVVDAKTALSAYLEAHEEEDEQKRNAFLVQHAQQVRNHIRILSQKAYWDQFQPSPEFVVMFLPAESFFSAALEKDPSLIEVGVKEKVILATPTTLIALLRSVAYGWRQESLTENAQHVSELGRELYKRLSDMTSHLTKLGKNVNQVVESYNQTIGTFERRVLVSARKMTDLDNLLDRTALNTPSILENNPRVLQIIHDSPDNPTLTEGEDSEKTII